MQQVLDRAKVDSISIRSNRSMLKGTSPSSVTLNLGFCKGTNRHHCKHVQKSIEWGKLNNFCDTMDEFIGKGWNAGIEIDYLLIEGANGWIT